MIKRYIDLFKVCNDLRGEYRDKEVTYEGINYLVIDIQAYYTTNMIQLVLQDELMILKKVKFMNKESLKASLT